MITARFKGTLELRSRLRSAPLRIRPALEVPVRDEARLFIQQAVKITPPASQGTFGNKAKQQGLRKVKRDIRRVYGLPGELYLLILNRDERLAAAFWKLVKAKDWVQANALSKRVTGIQMQPFDAGTLHRERRDRRGNVKDRDPSLFLQNDRDLNRYIRERQSHVGLLASGFNEAAAKLNARVPAWVKRHGVITPGGLVVKDAGSEFSIIITNTAPYAQAADMQRRMTYVAQYRQNALERKLAAVLRQESARIL